MTHPEIAPSDSLQDVFEMERTKKEALAMSLVKRRSLPWPRKEKKEAVQEEDDDDDSIQVIKPPLGPRGNRTTRLGWMVGKKNGVVSRKAVRRASKGKGAEHDVSNERASKMYGKFMQKGKKLPPLKQEPLLARNSSMQDSVATFSSQITPGPDLAGDEVEVMADAFFDGLAGIILGPQEEIESDSFSGSFGTDADGNTALSTHVEEIGTVIEEDLTESSSDISLSLQSACKVGDYDAVDQLVRKYPEQINDARQERSPLYLASHAGHTEIVRLLLKSGARDNDGTAYQSALNDAVRAEFKKFEGQEAYIGQSESLRDECIVRSRDGSTMKSHSSTTSRRKGLGLLQIKNESFAIAVVSRAPKSSLALDPESPTVSSRLHKKRDVMQMQAYLRAKSMKSRNSSDTKKAASADDIDNIQPSTFESAKLHLLSIGNPSHGPFEVKRQEMVLNVQNNQRAAYEVILVESVVFRNDIDVEPPLMVSSSPKFADTDPAALLFSSTDSRDDAESCQSAPAEFPTSPIETNASTISTKRVASDTSRLGLITEAEDSHFLFENLDKVEKELLSPEPSSDDDSDSESGSKTEVQNNREVASVAEESAQEVSLEEGLDVNKSTFEVSLEDDSDDVGTDVDDEDENPDTVSDIDHTLSKGSFVEGVSTRSAEDLLS